MSKDQNRTVLAKKAMLKAMKKYRGIVSHSLEAADVVRSTYYAWLKDDPEFKEDIEAINEGAIDFVESKLLDLIDGATEEVIHPLSGEIVELRGKPDKTAAIFFLKTRGKHRGYVERQEITGKDGEKLVNIVIPNGI
jgi:hypothetical protein